MPEVIVKAILSIGERELIEDLLLNSGASGIELVIKKSVADKLKLEPLRKTNVYPIGLSIKGDVAFVEVTIENPETGEKRKALLEAIILPDEILDYSLIGIVGQEKLRITPDVIAGKPIFK